MSSPLVFVVTGSNKGIGYAIVKGLAQQVPNAIIYMTARNEKLGKEAVSKVISELGEHRKSEIIFHQLDVTCRDSIQKCADHLKKEHGGIDVLINNAGVIAMFTPGDIKETPEEKAARYTIGTNYEGLKTTTDILHPLIRSGGRIVNVCSQAGLLKGYSEEIRKTLMNPSLTVSEIDHFCESYVKACIENNRAEKGFIESSYFVSKAAAVAISNIYARELKSRNIAVNACCPGYVATDLNRFDGMLTVEQGADTPIYLATMEGNEPTGKFIFKRREIDWANADIVMD